MTLKQIIFLLRYFTFCPIKSSSIRTSAIGPFEIHECDGLNHSCKTTPVLLSDLLFSSFSCIFQIFSIYSQPEGDMSLRKPMLRTGADLISNRHPFRVHVTQWFNSSILAYETTYTHLFFACGHSICVVFSQCLECALVEHGCHAKRRHKTSVLDVLCRRRYRGEWGCLF